MDGCSDHEQESVDSLSSNVSLSEFSNTPTNSLTGDEGGSLGKRNRLNHRIKSKWILISPKNKSWGILLM